LSSPLLFILTQLLSIVFLFIIALLLVVTHTFKLGTNTTSTYCLVIHHHLVAHFTSPFFVVMILHPHLQCACYLQLEHYGICNNDSLCTSKRWNLFFFLVCLLGLGYMSFKLKENMNCLPICMLWLMMIQS
jgi:hypothetical protein